MAVKVKVTGNGKFAGASSNIGGYSVTEESTPLDASDSSGATGSIQFEAVANSDTILLLNDGVELEDGFKGKTIGTINAVSVKDGFASITADSRLRMFVADKQTMPYVGTLGGALTYYFGLAGVTSGFNIDTGISSRQVVLPAWTGDLWTFLKMVCAVQRIEISLVSNLIVVRPIHSRKISTRRNGSESFSVENSELARNVEVVNYNTRYVVDEGVYPPGGWTPEVSTYQVEAGETIEYTIETNTSLMSVKNPIHVLNVSREYTGPDSVYSVSGMDGLPITPQQWLATGGRLTISINPDRRTLTLRITGARDTRFAPYRIAMSSGPSDYYSSLRIVGTGVNENKVTLSMPTGVSDDRTGVDVGVTIDNPAITNLSQAYDALIDAAYRYSMPKHTLTIDAAVVNRESDSGDLSWPTWTDFDSRFGSGTWAAFETFFNGQTWYDFDDYMLEQFDQGFANQAFGNIAGGLVEYGDNNFRVRSATVTQESINYSAETSVRYTDFDAIHGTKTWAQFEALYNGMAWQDFALMPLKGR